MAEGSVHSAQHHQLVEERDGSGRPLAPVSQMNRCPPEVSADVGTLETQILSNKQMVKQNQKRLQKLNLPTVIQNRIEYSHVRPK